MPVYDGDTYQRLRLIHSSIARIEASLAKENERAEKPLRGMTLAASTLSIVIAGLAALSTYKLGQQTQSLQQAVATQNQIHNLSSEDLYVREGAERFLAETQYADLALRQAEDSGDVESLRYLENTGSVGARLREESQEAADNLLKEETKDEKCFEGTWQERGALNGKGTLLDWTARIVGPKQLWLFRGSDQGGVSIRAHKVHPEIWLDRQFSYADRSDPMELVVQDQCSRISTNWGYTIRKVRH